jgi:hypothetical protein
MLEGGTGGHGRVPLRCDWRMLVRTPGWALMRSGVLLPLPSNLSIVITTRRAVRTLGFSLSFRSENEKLVGTQTRRAVPPEGEAKGTGARDGSHGKDASEIPGSTCWGRTHLW